MISFRTQKITIKSATIKIAHTVFLIFVDKTQTKESVRWNVQKMNIVSRSLAYGTNGVLVAKLN